MERDIGKSNKILIGVLAGLLLVIVGLTVGVVAIHLNKNKDVEIADNNEEEIDLEEDELFDGETMEDAKRKMAQDKEWKGIRQDIDNRVAELMNSDTVDVDAVNKIYNDGIKKANEFNRHDYVVDLIVSRTSNFKSKGLMQEALDALFTIDPEIFDNVEKYYYYTNIIDIAKELNDQRLISEYTAKRSEIEADFLEQTEERRRFTEAVGAEAEAYSGKENKNE